MTNVDDPDEDADNGDDLGEHVTEIIQFALERCLFGYLGRDGFVNITDCRFLAGVDNNSFGIPIDNGGTLRNR